MASRCRSTARTTSVHAGVAVKGSSPFPIVVAALGPQMLKVTAELADGTLTWCTGPKTLAEHTIPTINAAAEAAGRPAPRVIAALPVCVTADVAGARERAAKIFAVYGQLPSYRAMLDREGAAGPADIAIVGTADEVTEQVLALGRDRRHRLRRRRVRRRPRRGRRRRERRWSVRLTAR